MSYADKLRDKRLTISTIIHKYRTAQKTQKKQFFAFFEGEEDLHFYKHEVLKHSEEYDEFKHFICDGKRGVLAVRSEIEEKFPNAKNAFFFIDADHDHFTGVNIQIKKNTYMTPTYSIENLFCTTAMMEFFLERYVPLENDDEIFTNAVLSYSHSRMKFSRVMTKLMAIVIYLRKQKEVINLNNFKLDKVFVFGKNHQLNVATKPISQMIDDIAVNAPKCNFKEVRKEYELLLKKPSERYIRGKYDLWFFVSFINKFFNLHNGKKKNNGKKIKKDFELTVSNAIKILTNDACVPNCLSDFLQKSFQAL